MSKACQIFKCCFLQTFLNKHAWNQFKTSYRSRNRKPIIDLFLLTFSHFLFIVFWRCFSDKLELLFRQNLHTHALWMYCLLTLLFQQKLMSPQHEQEVFPSIRRGNKNSDGQQQPHRPVCCIRKRARARVRKKRQQQLMMQGYGAVCNLHRVLRAAGMHNEQIFGGNFSFRFLVLIRTIFGSVSKYTTL